MTCLLRMCNRIFMLYLSPVLEYFGLYVCVIVIKVIIFIIIYYKYTHAFNRELLIPKKDGIDIHEKRIT